MPCKIPQAKRWGILYMAVERRVVYIKTATHSTNVRPCQAKRDQPKGLYYPHNKRKALRAEWPDKKMYFLGSASTPPRHCHMSPLRLLCVTPAVPATPANPKEAGKP